jgi:hypothetical protein
VLESARLAKPSPGKERVPCKKNISMCPFSPRAEIGARHRLLSLLFAGRSFPTHLSFLIRRMKIADNLSLFDVV